MTPSDGFTGVSETENTIGQGAVEDLTPTINNPTDTKISTAERKIIHIFGPPNSGKTTLRRTLAEMHPDYPNFCIDDFRRRCGDGTLRGEAHSQIAFWDSMTSGGFFECSGAGKFVAMYLADFRYRPQYIVVMDTLADVCISRIREGKYDGIPFPFSDSDEELIRTVSRYLSSELFKSNCEGIPTIYLDTSQSIAEQAKDVERFAGLNETGGHYSDIQ